MFDQHLTSLYFLDSICILSFFKAHFLRIEAEKEARGEARARNKDIAAKISELCGGRVVTGQDVGNWFRNQKRQRTGPGSSNEAP